MPAREYAVTLNNPGLLSAERVERVFTAVREEAVVCLSDIKRSTELKYDIIRAALYYLESQDLIAVLDEDGRRLGMESHQMPVKITRAGRRVSSEEIVSAFLRQSKGEEAPRFVADCQRLSLST